MEVSQTTIENKFNDNFVIIRYTSIQNTIKNFAVWEGIDFTLDDDLLNTIIEEVLIYKDISENSDCDIKINRIVIDEKEERNKYLRCYEYIDMIKNIYYVK